MRREEHTWYVCVCIKAGESSISCSVLPAFETITLLVVMPSSLSSEHAKGLIRPSLTLAALSIDRDIAPNEMTP